MFLPITDCNVKKKKRKNYRNRKRFSFSRDHPNDIIIQDSRTRKFRIPVINFSLRATRVESTSSTSVFFPARKSGEDPDDTDGAERLMNYPLADFKLRYFVARKSRLPHCFG